MGYSISKLEIDAFRGINDPISLDLDGKSMIISSLNGQGKTSILRAIEFAIFGEVMEMSGSDYTRNRLEFSNKFTDKETTKVRLVLEDGEDELHLTRETPTDSGGSSITNLIIADRQISSNQEDALRKVLEIDHETFHLLSYLTQSNFQKLLKFKPKNRSEAFSKLLQTDQLNDIINQFTSAHRQVGDKHSTSIKNWENAKEKLAELQHDELEIQTRLDDLNADIKSLDIDPQSYDDERETLLNDLLEQQPDSTSSQLEAIRQELADFETSSSDTIFDTDELIEFRDQITEILSDISDYKDLIQNIAETDIDQLRSNRDDYQNKIDELEAEVDHNNKYTTFFEMAINDVLGPNTSQCPICDNSDFEVGSIKAGLRNKLQNLLAGSDLAAVKDQLETINGRLEEIEDQISKYLKAEKDAKELNSKIIDAHDDFHPLNKLSNVDYQVTSNISEIENYVKVYKNAIEEEIRSIKDTSEETERYATLIKCRDLLIIIGKIENNQNQLAALKDQLQAKKREINSLETIKNRYKEALEVLSQTQEYLVEVQQQVIEEKMDELNPIIDQIYSSIDPHPVWDQLVIDTQTTSRSNKYRTVFDFNTRQKENDEDITLNAYFSQGQANRSVLALIFAIAKVNRSKLDFQLLDDITQSLDGQIISKLADVLALLAEQKQVILATSDERLVEKVPIAFENASLPYHLLELSNWSPAGVKIGSLSTSGV